MAVADDRAVAVSSKDRKLLWGLSASRCAMCRRKLVEARTKVDPEAIVGDEAHISAQSPGGARFSSLPPGVSRDSYANLVLLCKVHHKVVDDQPKHYTLERMHEIKADHEKWVADRLADVQAPSVGDEIPGLMRMVPLTTGSGVWSILDDSEAYLLDAPADGEVDALAVDLADEFLQLCHDYGEVGSDLKDRGTSAVRDATRGLQTYVSRLASYGLLVFGARQLRTLPGYDPPLQFRVAVITVVRADNPAIRRAD